MSEPSAAACEAALSALLRGIPEEQRSHARWFLLVELERLYIAAGQPPPTWIGVLRTSAAGPHEG